MYNVFVGALPSLCLGCRKKTTTNNNEATGVCVLVDPTTSVRGGVCENSKNNTDVQGFNDKNASGKKGFGGDATMAVNR